MTGTPVSGAPGAKRGRAHISGRGSRICIVSRKDLGRITRVVRQAKVLADRGHQVTVISLKRPADELIATTPDVEYVEVSLEPWTRRLLLRQRQRRRRKLAARRELNRRRAGSGSAPGSSRPSIWRWLRLRRGHVIGRAWQIFIAAPTAFIVRLPGESYAARFAELAGISGEQVLQHYMRALAQRANSVSFADKACEAMAGRAFEVCQAHDNYALIAARRLAEQSGATLVYDAVEISEHRLAVVRSPLVRLTERLERREEARILRSADAVITIGDGLADWYARRHGISRPLPVRNCRYFRPRSGSVEIRRDCGVGDEQGLVVWFGYAYPQQGLETIVEAAAASAPDVHFALITMVLPRWVEFFDRLRATVTERELDGRIHFLPPRAPNELIDYISGADLGIIPRPNVSANIYYSMPNKFMEMVMARLPIAVSDLIDMRTLIERYGNGAVFDVNDPHDIAHTVERLLERKLQRVVHDALEAAARDLCWENEADAYARLVERLAGHPRRRGRRFLRARCPGDERRTLPAP